MFNLLALDGGSETTPLNVPWYMFAILGLVFVGYAAIEVHHTKKDHIIQFREAVNWSIIYVGAGVLFAVPVFIAMGGQASGEYLAAWAIEKSLSLDNLFVMGLIFGAFKVEPALERRMLNYGIAGAIIFRAIFILGGLALLKKFEWIGIIFGIILLRAAWNAFGEARGGDELDEEVEITEKRAWRVINRLFRGRIYPEFVGHKLTIKAPDKQGKIVRMFTMMFAVILLIEISDVIFAVDSVPAVLAVSPHAFIAYSSNVFAILGLRALFFVYQRVAEKFWALSWALAGILAWIAFKLIVAPERLDISFFGLFKVVDMEWINFHVSVAISLGVLGVLFAFGVAASLIWKKTDHHEIHVIDAEPEAAVEA